VTKRAPGLWKSSAPGPWATLERERGTVTVWSLGEDRCDVQTPDDSHEISGFKAARALAHVLAEQLGPPVDIG
jgi:hypothetical protein